LRNDARTIQKPSNRGQAFFIPVRSALILSPDSELRLILIRLLGRHGWSVDATACNDRALSFLAEDPKNLTLIDWEAPYAGVQGFLTAIRTHPVWHSARVLAICWGGNSEDAKQAVEFGASDILVKPLCSKDVLGKAEIRRPALQGIP
jgi:DNA-binding response OmpR family regulator